MTEWFEALDGLHQQVWRCLSLGVTDRDASARQPTLATISPDGWPEARTVVLRRAVSSEALLEVYTDSASDKIASLQRTPRAALHVWDPALDLQFRLQANVTLMKGEPIMDRWSPLPEVARLSYGVTPPPGTPIADARDYQKSPDQSRFCVLSLKLIHIDVVHLGTHHRRASFNATDNWAGQWLVP
ncbi:pyridoxamine 5'-phosphate oxidase family protein [Loktanella sp. DJP18]|uniref:pyridoxamine 5'-phosphate oxidase family protein n=1 Tax=Loktanella sp. DJP18 TaxID=3409788 RepID=UPI003BB64239